MEDVQGSRHFQISTAIFMEMRTVDIASGSLGRGAAHTKRTQRRAEPASTLGIIVLRYSLIAPIASSTTCPYSVSVRALLRAARCSSCVITRSAAATSDTLGTCG